MISPAVLRAGRSGGRGPLDAREKPMDYTHSQRVHDPGEEEERDISVEPLQGVTRYGRDDHTSHGAGGPAQSYH